MCYCVTYFWKGSLQPRFGDVPKGINYSKGETRERATPQFRREMMGPGPGMEGLAGNQMPVLKMRPVAFAPH